MDKSNKGATPYDARAIANLVLDKADEIGAGITQLQLYKIMYFAHGWYLATEGQWLVLQDFQAWSYGPVIRVVRDAFKGCGKAIIRTRAQRLNIYTGEFTAIDQVLDEKVIAFIDKIVRFYHAYDGWQLSDMTHEEGSPWDQVWNSKKPIGNLGLRIDESLIRNHFSRLPNRFSQN
jgi:uncharacterized phage-associated protein